MKGGSEGVKEGGRERGGRWLAGWLVMEGEWVADRKQSR